MVPKSRATPSPFSSLSSCVRDACGAVYVEFLIAFLPFFGFFLCLWQVSILYYTKLMVDNAAFAAARAGAVIVAENPRRVDPQGGDASVNRLTKSRDDYVRTAAEIALAPLILDGTILSVKVVYPQPSQPGGADAMRDQTYPGMRDHSASLMRVRVETIMNCKIGLANAVMCPPRTLLGLILKEGLHTFIIPVVSEGIFPYQGASYTYNPKDDSGRAGSDALATADWGGLCFAAGTMVETPDGPRPIEEVRAGDTVTSRDEKTGENRVEHVVATSVRKEQAIVEVELREGDALRVTPSHPFGTSDRGWVAASDLAPGDRLVTATGDDAHVRAVRSLEGRETVYNFEVEHTHTYFVGHAEALVHNACDTAIPPIPGLTGGGFPQMQVAGSGMQGLLGGLGGLGGLGNLLGGGGGGPGPLGGGPLGLLGGGGGNRGGGGGGGGGGNNNNTPDPPGNCTQQQHDALQATVDQQCKTNPFSCTNRMSCAEVKSRMRRAMKCAMAREAINNTCFNGGNAGHRQAAQNARAAQQNCNDLIAVVCK